MHVSDGSLHLVRRFQVAETCKSALSRIDALRVEMGSVAGFNRDRKATATELYKGR
jgi:hypothetical protein